MSAYTCFHCKMTTPDAPDTEPEIWNLISNHACLKDKVNLCLDENSVVYAEDQIGRLITVQFILHVTHISIKFD